jgi:hypothetical protein
MRYLVAAAVVAMLIGAPMGSFFYLKYGLKYRLETQAQLSPKDIDQGLNVQVTGLLKESNAAMIHLGGPQDVIGIELLQKLDERIVDRDNFELLSNADPASFDSKAKIRFYNNDSLSDSLNYQFILVDTSGIVRYEYAYGVDHAKEMIRHLSVVIPLPKHREIKLKREIED